MAARKSSLIALPFNCDSQEPDNITLVKDNGLPADLTSKGYFGLAFHYRRHSTCSSCTTSGTRSPPRQYRRTEWRADVLD
jgi:hypothetical protein